MNRLLVLLLMSSCLLSCKKSEDQSCLKGKGNEVTVTRSLSAFNSLSLFDGVELTLIQDSVEKIVITCGENLVNFVNTDVENGTLTISDDNRCTWLRDLPVKIKAELHYRALDYVYNESHGNISMQTTHTGQSLRWENWHVNGRSDLKLDVNIFYSSINAGASELTVSGQCDEAYYYLSGYGHIRAKGLESDFCWGDHNGTGELELRCADGGVLEYAITNYGDLIYWGEPDLIQAEDHSGSGTLISQ